MTQTKPNINEIGGTLVELFPKLNEKEQRIAARLYKLLAQGRPIKHEYLAESLKMTTQEIDDVVDNWSGVYHDEKKTVQGFWGLALPEMKHRFLVEGRQLFTWCAWDSLFIPRIIGKTAKVQSPCPITGERIQLTVSPDGIESMAPKGAVMSLLTPAAAKVKENVIFHFCHYVYFFKTEEAGRKWTAENEGTFLVTIEEGFELGRVLVDAKYDRELLRE